MKKDATFDASALAVLRTASDRTEKLQHFTWPVRGLKSGISQIRKKFQNPVIARIMALFSDLRNSTFKYPYRPSEVPPFLPPRLSHTYTLHSYGPKK